MICMYKNIMGKKIEASSIYYTSMCYRLYYYTLYIVQLYFGLAENRTFEGDHRGSYWAGSFLSSIQFAWVCSCEGWVALCLCVEYANTAKAVPGMPVCSVSGSNIDCLQDQILFPAYSFKTLIFNPKKQSFHGNIFSSKAHQYSTYRNFSSRIMDNKLAS